MTAHLPITDLTTLAKALAIVRKERGLSQLAMDYTAGLAEGHTAKLECGDKGFGKISLPLVLQALDVELICRKRDASMRSKYAKMSKEIIEMQISERRKMAKKRGGYVKNQNMSTQQKRAHGRKMAKSRWAKARARKAAK